MKFIITVSLLLVIYLATGFLYYRNDNKRRSENCDYYPKPACNPKSGESNIVLWPISVSENQKQCHGILSCKTRLIIP